MDKATKDFIIKQRTETEKTMDKRLKKTVITLTKRIDDQAEESRRYLGALKEDTDSKFQALMEVVGPIATMQQGFSDTKELLTEIQPKLDLVVDAVQEMKPVLDATFEKVGEITMDYEMILIGGT